MHKITNDLWAVLLVSYNATISIKQLFFTLNILSLLLNMQLSLELVIRKVFVVEVAIRFAIDADMLY